MSTRSFHDLIVWQKSKDFTADIYNEFSQLRDFSFRDQIQRAALSVMNNIAEGYARRSDRAFKNFLYIAKGSIAETESMLILALELNYLNKKQWSKLTERASEIGKMLTAFVNKL